MTPCPFCGQPTPPVDAEKLYMLPLSPAAKTILRTMLHVRPRPATISILAVAVYKGARMPRDYSAATRKIIAGMNPNLKTAGYRIENIAARGRGNEALFLLKEMPS